MLTASGSLEWVLPAKHPELSKDEVHVWRSSLDVSSSRLFELRQMLSVDEATRACAYQSEEAARRFIVSRTLLRKIVAGYLRIEPCELKFTYSSRGKPEAGSMNATIRFSKSCSRGLAVFAVTRDCDIGIDVEWFRADFPVDSLAKTFFAPEEQIALRSFPAALAQKCFFSCWTRKEAIVKALGLGLSSALPDPAVSVLPDAPGKQLWACQGGLSLEEFALIDVPLNDGYIGALAVRMPAASLSYWDASAL